MKWRINFFVNIDREQQWLNKLSQEGWELKKIKWFGMLCGFERCEPEQYQYLIEIEPSNKNNKQGQTYQQFLEDMGIVCVKNCMGCSYYKKENDGTAFELYSDRYSKIAAGKRKSWIYAVIAAVLLVETIAVFSLLFSGGIEQSAFWLFLILIAVNIAVSIRFLWLFYSYLKKTKTLKRQLGEQNEFLTAEEAKKQRTFFTPMMRYLLISMAVGTAIGGLLGVLTALL